MDLLLQRLLLLLMVWPTLSLLIPRAVPGDVGLEGPSSVLLGDVGLEGPSSVLLRFASQEEPWELTMGKQSNLGNALMVYWNTRAYAVLKNLDFFMESNRTDLVSNFPTTVKQEDTKPYLTKSRLELYEHLQHQNSTCWDCPFPHHPIYAPWRIMGDMILSETRSVVQRVVESSPATTKEATSWSQRKNWAVYHYRCDHMIFHNNTATWSYGFLPHRFITKAIPGGTTTLLIVSHAPNPNIPAESVCSNVLNDLADFVRSEGRAVEFQQSGQSGIEDDWLTLATAPTLICSPSTYCFTAAMGNPNRVYFPMNGENMIVPADGKDIRSAQKLRSPNFRWVETDYMPGPLAAENEMSWEALREYLRSKDSAAVLRGHLRQHAGEVLISPG